MPITKKKLEMLLESCSSFSEPDIKREQYTTPASIASKILHYAFLKGDIEGKVIYDLGCGTGRFAIGCALLGAAKTYGFDLDESALEIAKENADKLLLDNIKWMRKDIGDVEGVCDTVFQNPPFGVQQENADRIFLEKAFEVGNVIYTIHKSGTGGFIRGYIKKLGGIVTDVMSREFVIPHTYKFHRKELKRIKVDVYRARRK